MLGYRTTKSEPDLWRRASKKIVDAKFQDLPFQKYFFRTTLFTFSRVLKLLTSRPTVLAQHEVLHQPIHLMTS